MSIKEQHWRVFKLNFDFLLFLRVSKYSKLGTIKCFISEH